MIRAGVGAVILAAGDSRRMRGADKLAEPVAGEALLHRTARIACESIASEAVVVLGAHAPERRALISGLPVRCVVNPQWSNGMSGSIACGVAALDESASGAMIVLSDMPGLSTALLDRLLNAFVALGPEAILRPVSPDGLDGNPVIFGAEYFPALRELEGDAGARAVIAAAPEAVHRIRIDDPAITLDLDTPEDWAAWRERQRG